LFQYIAIYCQFIANTIYCSQPLGGQLSIKKFVDEVIPNSGEKYLCYSGWVKYEAFTKQINTLECSIAEGDDSLRKNSSENIETVLDSQQQHLEAEDQLALKHRRKEYSLEFKVKFLSNWISQSTKGVIVDSAANVEDDSDHDNISDCEKAQHQMEWKRTKMMTQTSQQVSETTVAALAYHSIQQRSGSIRTKKFFAWPISVHLKTL
jgi:hypothetical protein